VINTVCKKTTKTYVHDDSISDTHSDTHTSDTLVSISDTESDKDDKKLYQNVEIRNQSKEETEISKVLKSIDVLVHDHKGALGENRDKNRENEKSKELKKDVMIERLSPLEEFNTLHNHVKEIRASIRLRESNVV